MNLYPVNLRITGKLCVIVGGGGVAARKIGALLNCGARVCVISPEAVPAVHALAESGVITFEERKYRKGDLEGAFMVFAATDNHTVQRQVAKEADARGILLNSADDPDGCTFQVPARVRRGNFLMTVSTGGSSPALAAKLRRRFEREFGLEYEHYVDLLGRIREKILADGNPSSSHKVLFEQLLQLDIDERIRREDWAALQQDLSHVLSDRLDVDELIASILPEKPEHGTGNDAENRGRRE